MRKRQGSGILSLGPQGVSSVHTTHPELPWAGDCCGSAVLGSAPFLAHFSNLTPTSCTHYALSRWLLEPRSSKNIPVPLFSLGASLALPDPRACILLMERGGEVTFGASMSWQWLSCVIIALLCSCLIERIKPQTLRRSHIKDRNPRPKVLGPLVITCREGTKLQTPSEVSKKDIGPVELIR